MIIVIRLAFVGGSQQIYAIFECFINFSYTIRNVNFDKICAIKKSIVSNFSDCIGYNYFS